MCDESALTLGFAPEDKSTLCISEKKILKIFT